MNIDIDGYNVLYKITGNGKQTVVILQGWGTSLEIYDSIAHCIDSQYRVIQFDFPGFGSSDEPREAWNVDAYADFFIKFMSAMNITEAILIGHSYGGRVIIKLASRNDLPFSISRIVLIDSAGILPKRSLIQKAKILSYKILKRIFSLKVVYILFPELVDDWKQHQGSADYRNASNIMKQCLVMAVNEDLTNLLPLIQQDTLLIWGENDTATPIGDAKIMEQRITNSGLVVLQGAGHYCFLEQPMLFEQIIKSYFQVEVSDGN